ncbi:MAG: hypothetical protein JZU63_10260 [Rhodoferax sp.]|nr:hypothetical protein [Rhodoferax sp.]
MKRSITEIGMGSGGLADKPGDSSQGPWGSRMKWSPNSGGPSATPGQSRNPRLHPDEEAALAGSGLGTADDFIEDPSMGDPTISDEAGGTVPITQRNPSQLGGQGRYPLGKPDLGGSMMTPGDVDSIIQQIRAEQALPPHKQNSAKIAQLKAEATRMMAQEESLRIQRRADQLLPRVNS